MEMSRTSGDPVLFVKPAAEGYQAGALPSVLDYGNFSDSVSFRERLDQHSRLLHAPPAGLCARFHVLLCLTSLLACEPPISLL